MANNINVLQITTKTYTDENYKCPNSAVLPRIMFIQPTNIKGVTDPDTGTTETKAVF